MRFAASSASSACSSSTSSVADMACLPRRPEAALLLRCFVATFPHSGQATPPKYGDYEVRKATPRGYVALPILR